MKRRLRSALTISLALFLFAAGGCSKSDKPEVSAATPKPSANPSPASAVSPAAKEATADGAFACTLLTREETEAVQGESFKDAKPSQKVGAGLIASQCYFELPTVVNSIVLNVTQKAPGPDGRDPKQSWQDVFHGDASKKKSEEEEKGERGPEKIDGIGDEAFWTGTRVGGALYVLKGNSYIRISIGGASDREEKIKKSKTLAESVLKRL